MRKLISDQVKIEMYRLYKEENKRAQEIADHYGISVQHLLRIFRVIEGKPVFIKKSQNVMYSDRIGNRWFQPITTLKDKED